MSAAFEDLVADFEFIDDWEERYKYLIDLGKQLPHFDEADKTEANKVHGCVSQVWVKPHTERSPDGRLELHFTGDSDALIVRGLLYVVHTLMSGLPVGEVAALDAQAQLQRLHLSDHLTPQRSNGLVSMIARIKQLASSAA